MKVYRLNIRPNYNDADLEVREPVQDEFYGTLADAKKRRTEIQRIRRGEVATYVRDLALYQEDTTGEVEHPTGVHQGRDLSIDRMKLSDITARQLVIRVLNRRGYVADIKKVVKAVKAVKV